MAKRKKKKKPAAKPAPDWLTLAEAKEADDERHVNGVLIDLGQGTLRGAPADPRWHQVGIKALRIVAHDCDVMKAAKAAARKAAVNRHNEVAPKKVWSWEKLPPEGHAEWEMETAIASLRGGEGLDLHGDFEVIAQGEAPATSEVQAVFREKLPDAPNWLISGLYHAGSKILSDPNEVPDRALLEIRKKGYAYPLGSLLASLVGGAMGNIENIGGLLSNLANLASAASGSQSTTPRGRAPKTEPPLRSTG